MPSKMKTCEDYRTAMTDAAAAAVEPSLELRSHLDACAPCHAAFADETQLFAAIDLGVRSAANAEVPASLIPRVRVQLNEQAVPRRSWIPAAAVVAAAVAVVALLAFARGFGHDIVSTRPAVNSSARSISPAQSQPAPPAVAHNQATNPQEPAAMNAHATRKESTRVHLAANTAELRQVSVLIPVGQKEAVDKLLGTLQRGAVKQDPLVAENSEQPSQGRALLPLAISPMEIEPLATVSEESAPGNETTRF